MRMLDRQSAEEFLARQAVSPAEIVKLMTGFDLSRPMYAQHFWPGDKLYQFIRLPSASDSSPSTGNWFGLSGVTTSGAAIHDGLSGRRLVEFTVISTFEALEGTAARFDGSLHSALGGPGGATQIYIPRLLLHRVSNASPADRW